MTDTLTIPRPDDMHLHLRDDAMLAAVAPVSAVDFGRAIIMPNLVPPVVTGADAVAYRGRILAALDGAAFEPLMTLYLTEATDPEDVALAAASGLIKAMKLYPAGATTNSDSGVRDFDKVRPVLERMAEIGLPLCVHGEVTDAEVDIFDREAVFLDWPGAFALITTACPWPSERRIAQPFWKLRHQATRGSFWAPTARRMWMRRRRRGVAVRGVSPRSTPCPFLRRCLNVPGRSTGWRGLSHASGRSFMACRLRRRR